LQLLQVRHQISSRPVLVNDSQQDQSVDLNVDDYIDKDKAIQAAIAHLETDQNIPEIEKPDDAIMVDMLKQALTQKQRYPKIGGVEIAGIPIAIENPEHSKREGVDKDGTPWSITMRDHYGYIEDVMGADGDELDCFIKPGTHSDWVGDIYVIEQLAPDGKFDDDKVMIGYDSEGEAKAAYMRNYADDWQGF